MNRYSSSSSHKSSSKAEKQSSGTISAIILTKNEQDMIEECLESLSFCDEIVVIDSQSTDQTLSIVKKFAARVFEDESKDFSAKRNMGREKAKSDWLLYVDADERVSSELQESIERLLHSETEFSGYRVKRKNYYFGHPWPQEEQFLRLFKKESLVSWEGELHETAEVRGEVGEIEGYLFHYTHRDLFSMLSKTIDWSETEANLRYATHHPTMTWWRFPRVMVNAFYRSYISQKGWKAGTVGLIESIYQAFSAFVTYARLWEIQQKVKTL